MVDEHVSSKLYHVSNGVITWGCSHEYFSAKMTVEFQLFHGLGQITVDLEDVSHCRISEIEDSILYFSKRNSQEWKHDLEAFGQKITDWTKFVE